MQFGISNQLRVSCEILLTRWRGRHEVWDLVPDVFDITRLRLFVSTEAKIIWDCALYFILCIRRFGSNKIRISYKVIKDKQMSFLICGR